jgi:hypothetical protein
LELSLCGKCANISAVAKCFREILRKSVLNFTRGVWGVSLCLKGPKNKRKLAYFASLQLVLKVTKQEKE